MSYKKNGLLHDGANKAAKNNIYVQLLLLIVIGLLLFIPSYFLVEDSSQKAITSFTGFSKTSLEHISNILVTISTIIISSAIVDFFLTTNSFLKIIMNAFEKTITEKDFINRLSEKEISSILDLIKKTYPHIKIHNRKVEEDSIILAKQETKRLIKIARQQLSNSTIDDEDIKRRATQNYFIRKSDHSRTVMKNGTEISTYALDIEIIENGPFYFYYRFSSSNKEKLLPSFDEFLRNIDDRFSKNSFFADVIEYRRDGSKRDCKCLNIITINDGEIDKEVLLAITDCYEGDSFILSFSLTVEDEITEETRNTELESLKKSNLSRDRINSDTDENYKKMKEEEVHGAISRNPVGIRSIKFQQERYGDINTIELSPSIKIGSTQIMPIKESRNIYYDIVEWRIYYKQDTDGKLVFRLL